MPTAGNPPPSSRPDTPSRVSVWAILSVTCALLPLPVLRGVPLVLLRLVWWLQLISLAVAVAAGIVALVLIRSHGDRLRGKYLAWAGIGIPIAYIAFILLSAHNLNRLLYRPMQDVRVCQGNISALYTAIEDYAASHGGLIPDGVHWCDQLLSSARIDPQLFVCPFSVTEPHQATYALNMHVAGKLLAEIPDDTVILFESAPGWNQTGDTELVARENHSLAGTKYFNVVLAGGRVQCWPCNRATELRWQP